MPYVTASGANRRPLAPREEHRSAALTNMKRSSRGARGIRFLPRRFIATVPGGILIGRYAIADRAITLVWRMYRSATSLIVGLVEAVRSRGYSELFLALDGVSKNRAEQFAVPALSKLVRELDGPGRTKA